MANVLTEKFGPLPAWGWGVAAGGSFLLYRWWKNRQAGTTTAITAATSAAPAPMPTPSQPVTFQTPSGYSFSGSGQDLAGLVGSGVIPTGAVATPASASPSSSTNPPQVGSFVGSGYNPIGPFTQALGGQQYYYVQTPSVAQALQAGGQQLYFEPAPGVFAPQTYGSAATAPGTATYAQVPSK